MSHRVTFICDSCEKQFMADESMDIPPHWFAVQFAVAAKDGLVPVKERDVFLHFCTQKCIVEYAKGNDLKHRLCTVDQDEDEDMNNAE